MNNQANPALLARIANKCTSELIEWNNNLVFSIRDGRAFPTTEDTLKLVQAELLSRGV
jgi:hypothetical protein